MMKMKVKLMGAQHLSLKTFYDLVEEKVSENNKIEFKKFQFVDGKITAEQKEKLEKEIAAFANAEGGTIYIGIDESREKIASQVVGVGCGIEKFDEIQLAIQSRLLAKVHPRIYGISMECFALPNNDMVMTISVPKSISRPHAVNDGNKDNFYIRHSNGVTNMSLDDLRREILAGASYQSEIKKFRQDRVGMIMSNEYIRHLQDGAKLVVHIIPLWSLEFGNSVDLEAVNSWTSKDPFWPMSGSGCDMAYCSDGKLAFSVPYRANYVQSSVLLLRSGIIEAIDVRMMNCNAEIKQAFQWCEIEKTVRKKLDAYSSLLQKLDVPKPWYLSVCITNGKGYWTDSYGEESAELHSDYIQAVDVIWNDGQTLNETIQPCLDSLANAFGFPKSFLDYSDNKS